MWRGVGGEDLDGLYPCPGDAPTLYPSPEWEGGPRPTVEATAEQGVGGSVLHLSCET